MRNYCGKVQLAVGPTFKKYRGLEVSCFYDLTFFKVTLGTLKRDLKAAANRALENFKLHAPKLAKQGKLNLLFDHQTLGSLAHENSSNSLGIMLGKA